MKKTILLIAISMFSLVQVSLAGDNGGNGNINRTVQIAFQKIFKNASQVSWLESKDVYIASFIQEGKKLIAYFDADANWIGTGRHIGQENLPLGVSQQLYAKYKMEEIRGIYEFNDTGEGTYYFISVEKNGKMKTIKVDALGRIDSWKPSHKIS